MEKYLEDLLKAFDDDYDDEKRKLDPYLNIITPTSEDIEEPNISWRRWTNWFKMEEKT